MNGPAPRILMVEDDEDLAAGVRANLIAEGYRVRVVGDGEQGLAAAVTGEFDLLLLDVMLPNRDGYSLCRELRGRGNDVPVLFLTARGDPDERVRGLEEGGDDYIAKPFELRELLARIAAMLRRAQWYAGGRNGEVVFGGNRVDLRRYRAVAHDGQTWELTHKEAMVLKCLADRAGEVVTRHEILERVWGVGSMTSSRTIDNFIVRLRRRFETDPSQPRHFHTVHGAGYRFTSRAEPETDD